MTISDHIPTFVEKANEDVDVGDSVFVEKKGVSIEASVIKRTGQRIRILPEDKSGELWVACEECTKVVKGGAEELIGRAARVAEQKAREEAARKAEEERKAAEAAEKANYEKIQADRVGNITNILNRRSVPSRDWCPIGKYNWTESPVLMDQTKDAYRIIWYEIAVDKDYGAVREPPQIDLSAVEELKEAAEVRKKEKAAADKEAAKKNKNKKKPTDAELQAIQDEKDAEEAADLAEQEAARKTAEKIHKREMDKFTAEEKVRVITKPLPLYPPDLPPVLDPPEHPSNEALYKKLLAQGHAGDRIFYTDGTIHNNPYVIGSDDKVLKGGGLLKEVCEAMGWQTKTVTFKAAYDGGVTLKKHDCFPEEDPAEWYFKDEDKWSGEFRKDQDGYEDW